MSDLNRHVKSDKVKWVITAIAFVLAFVMIIGVFMQTFMPEGQRPTDWFEKQPAQEEELPEEQPEDDGGAVIDQTSDNGVKVMTAKIAPEQYAEYGVSALAENAYTLTATVSGDADAAVTYSAAWKNPSSEWATGKNVSDYVTVSQGSVGSQTATVSVLQAFSEQVIITACVTDYPDISATCTVDYVATFDITSNTTLADLNSKFSLSITDIVGTLACETSGVVEFEVSLPPDVLSSLKSICSEGEFQSSFTLNKLDISDTFEMSSFSSKDYYTAIEVFDMYYENCVSGISYEDFYNALSSIILVNSLSDAELYFEERPTAEFHPFLLSVTIDRRYKDKSYGTVVKAFTYTVTDITDFPTYASGIELDNSSIIAG